MGTQSLIEKHHQLGLLMILYLLPTNCHIIVIIIVKDLSVLHTETMSVSPGILIPFYDEDSSTLFLSGKLLSILFYKEDLSTLFHCISIHLSIPFDDENSSTLFLSDKLLSIYLSVHFYLSIYPASVYLSFIPSTRRTRPLSSSLVNLFMY